MVSPDRRMQGIGESLTKYIVAWADREGLENYLQSQMAAHTIHRRFGWVDVGKFDTDLSQRDPEGPEGKLRIFEWFAYCDLLSLFDSLVSEP